jgi:hypothetical protein
MMIGHDITNGAINNLGNLMQNKSQPINGENKTENNQHKAGRVGFALSIDASDIRSDLEPEELNVEGIEQFYIALTDDINKFNTVKKLFQH